MLVLIYGTCTQQCSLSGITGRGACHSQSNCQWEASEDIGEGAVWGGVTNHIKGFMLHLLEDQRDILAEGP